MPASALQSMPLEEALEHINVPSYLIDSTGIIRWLNPAARSLVGEVRGRQFTSVVAPEQTRRARELFARKIVGAARVTDAAVVLVDADGDRIGVEVSSVPLYQGEHRFGTRPDEETPLGRVATAGRRRSHSRTIAVRTAHRQLFARER